MDSKSAPLHISDEHIHQYAFICDRQPSASNSRAHRSDVHCRSVTIYKIILVIINKSQEEKETN